MIDENLLTREIQASSMNFLRMSVGNSQIVRAACVANVGKFCPDARDLFLTVRAS